MALHRPYIRKGVRMEVESRALKNEQGQFLDANTGKPIEGKYDLGHKTGQEYRTALREAEKQGLSQKEFNEQQNNAEIYQIEDPSSNRSHEFEEKSEEVQEQSQGEEAGEEAGAEESGGEDGGMDGGEDGGEDGGMDGGDI